MKQRVSAATASKGVSAATASKGVSAATALCSFDFLICFVI
jgi:hypothetical protein